MDEKYERMTEEEIKVAVGGESDDGTEESHVLLDPEDVEVD